MSTEKVLLYPKPLSGCVSLTYSVGTVGQSQCGEHEDGAADVGGEGGRYGKPYRNPFAEEKFAIRPVVMYRQCPVREAVILESFRTSSAVPVLAHEGLLNFCCPRTGCARVQWPSNGPILDVDHPGFEPGTRMSRISDAIQCGPILVSGEGVPLAPDRTDTSPCSGGVSAFSKGSGGFYRLVIDRLVLSDCACPRQLTSSCVTPQLCNQIHHELLVFVGGIEQVRVIAHCD